MLRPAASKVAAAAARKTLIEPHEAKDGSPPTGWKSRHAGTWARRSGSGRQRAAVVCEWAVREGLAGRTS